MIGSLLGDLAQKQAPYVVVQCGGVGYEVETPMSTFLELPEVGANVFLHIHFLVRQDAQILYGFTTREEKSLFRLLLKVSGVGAKMGLAILSAMSVSDFERCVQLEDTAMLTKIPGVGKKTADRLIIEMRDKIFQEPSQKKTVTGVTVGSDPRSEAVDALVSLGYKPAEVQRLLSQLDLKEKSAEDIIRLALRQAIS